MKKFMLYTVCFLFLGVNLSIAQEQFDDVYFNPEQDLKFEEQGDNKALI